MNFTSKKQALVRRFAALFLIAALTSAFTLLGSCKEDPADPGDDPNIDFIYDPDPYEPTEDSSSGTEEPLPEGTISYKISNPKAGYLEGETKQTLKDGEKSSRVEVFANLGYRFAGWSDGCESAVREGDGSKKSGVIYALFDYVGLPILELETDLETLTKEDYQKGRLSVSNVPDRFALTEEPLQLRGRGNASFTFEKKSFKLKFGSKTSLLGLGEEAKDWVLIANHTDKSLLRNYFAYTLQTKLDYSGYSFACTMVSLYVSGEYMGVYLVCPSVEIGNGRIPVSDIGGQDDTGFLLEWDNYYSGKEDRDYVTIRDGQIHFTVKSTIRTNGQAEYLKDYLSRCDAAIASGDREQIEALIDLPSLLDAYLLEEFTKNIDVGWSSFYFYIPERGGRLVFGPCWDFDLSAGNDRRLDYGNYTGIYAGASLGYKQENYWFSDLMTYDWFREAVKERWQEVSPIIQGVIIEVEAYARLHFDHLSANFDRWDIFYIRISQEPTAVMRRTTYEEQLRYLFDWYKSRLYWLDREWSTENYGSSGDTDSGPSDLALTESASG